MIERIFLGWERPFLGVGVDWLWERREEMARMLVVVPTAQSGRRMRLALAERGACLAPRVVTPGCFLQTEDPRLAPEALELVAWVEVLERIRDWEAYAAVFPKAPGEGEAPGWALGLARALRGLRGSLQENALTLAMAARRMEGTVEAERWQALAAMESQVEGLLGSWGKSSRSRTLAQGGWQLPVGIERVVLAGVADMPAAVVRVLRSLQVPVISLVGAPEAEGAAFDDIGRPLADVWNGRVMPWPEGARGSVEVVADPRQQAQKAVWLAGRAGTTSDRLALGTADEETAGELVRAFGRAGWTAHDPSRVMVSSSGRWFAVWRRYVSSPEVTVMADLLGFPETEVLIGSGRARLAEDLSGLRDRYLCLTWDDLRRLAGTREPAGRVMRGLQPLIGWREAFTDGGFIGGMDALLDEFSGAGIDVEEMSGRVDALREVAMRLRRDAGFWLDVMSADGFELAPEVPQDRVLDVQGWLELFHEPGPHLVLCGMNEGKVPGRADGDPWLSENARRVLGLATDASRAARDAYLFAAMVAARRADGRVDVLLGKSSGGGDALLPSRLLLAAGDVDLPGRVRILFRNVEPPDAGIAWAGDWKWKPREEDVVPTISVTAFGDYLACPFRYYLKHVMKMTEPEPERREWNAREFGTVMHAVLENWGRDEEAREFSKAEAIEAWVRAELERFVMERYGKHPPLALRIQQESMKQRLAWFAQKQACEAAGGWRIERIESSYKRQLGDIVMKAKVDRIDIHHDGRRRVLDYKTAGELKDVEAMHRTTIVSATRMPAHLEGVDAVRCEVENKGGMVQKRWKNLQVALYAAVIGEVDEVGYFGLGATEGDVGVKIWNGFTAADSESAMRCAEWVVSRIAERAFWPPAEKVDYDDYGKLAMGRHMEDMVEWHGKGGAA